MKYIALITALLIWIVAGVSQAEPSKPYKSKQKKYKKIAVIDTGFTANDIFSSNVRLCDSGHFDFETMQPVVGQDTIGHGTIVSILAYATSAIDKTCIVVYNVWTNRGNYIANAIEMAIKNKVDAINISMSGFGYDFREKKAIKKAVKNNIAVFVAAGNNAQNLNEKCNVYPACYTIQKEGFYVVGASDVRGLPVYYSNFGTRVKIWKNGNFLSPFSTGTSFASPRAAGSYIKEKLRKK